jgi:hypothetical protein
MVNATPRPIYRRERPGWAPGPFWTHKNGTDTKYRDVKQGNQRQYGNSSNKIIIIIIIIIHSMEYAP